MPPRKNDPRLIAETSLEQARLAVQRLEARREKVETTATQAQTALSHVDAELATARQMVLHAEAHPLLQQTITDDVEPLPPVHVEADATDARLDVATPVEVVDDGTTAEHRVPNPASPTGYVEDPY